MSKILIVEDDEKLSKELKIFLDKNGYDAVIVPEWRGNAGGNTYEFAVDFGTTNTHIEYKVVLELVSLWTYLMSIFKCLVSMLML